ncbi:hypothetical protein [Ketobacter sp.]|uniref:hypothetical protein n=1 Tax=Ketobacter sp. TaxID=2083498 RepID=UPI000F1907FE|nr:hypothetical protein [Ketobacter sp.]RLU00316.1 MAG: hypothetical protein D9N14_07445 [Ketobacter sp.]
MSNQPVVIADSGMVCGVGLDAPSACAAIRCAMDNFQETRFVDKGGEWIIGSSVPLATHWRGRTKLAKMASMALQECLQHFATVPSEIPLFLCVAERERPGRMDGLEEHLFGEIEAELGYQFHAQESRGIPLGRVSAAVALKHARELIYEKQFPYVLIAGVDSLLNGATLGEFEAEDRLLTSQNSNGFIPGEAAAAILVCHPSLVSASDRGRLLCQGLGFAQEEATVTAERPLRADGLTAAIKNALADAQCTMGDLDFRIADVSGEQYYFKEAALALTRTLRTRKEHFYIWHPADCIGEVGAAMGVVMLVVALAGSRKGYASGRQLLCQFGNDAGQRAVAISRYETAGA